MAETMRLSEASRQVAEALAMFDDAALQRVAARLERVMAGEIEIAGEPARVVENRQHGLAKVLAKTEQNIDLLRRLRERKARNEWAL